MNPVSVDDTKAVKKVKDIAEEIFGSDYYAFSKSLGLISHLYSYDVNDSAYNILSTCVTIATIATVFLISNPLIGIVTASTYVLSFIAAFASVTYTFEAHKSLNYFFFCQVIIAIPWSISYSFYAAYNIKQSGETNIERVINVYQRYASATFFHLLVSGAALIPIFCCQTYVFRIFAGIHIFVYMYSFLYAYFFMCSVLTLCEKVHSQECKKASIMNQKVSPASKDDYVKVPQDQNFDKQTAREEPNVDFTQNYLKSTNITKVEKDSKIDTEANQELLETTKKKKDMAIDQEQTKEVQELQIKQENTNETKKDQSKQDKEQATKQFLKDNEQQVAEILLQQSKSGEIQNNLNQKKDEFNQQEIQEIQEQQGTNETQGQKLSETKQNSKEVKDFQKDIVNLENSQKEQNEQLFEKTTSKEQQEELDQQKLNNQEKLIEEKAQSDQKEDKKVQHIEELKIEQKDENQNEQLKQDNLFQKKTSPIIEEEQGGG